MRGVQSVIVRLGIMTEINKARGGALKWRLAKFMQGYNDKFGKSLTIKNTPSSI